MEINTTKIKQLLKQKGWGIPELSMASSLSIRTIETIFQKRTTKLKTINKLGIILDVNPRDLLT